jgi:hypothetical protein
MSAAQIDVKALEKDCNVNIQVWRPGGQFIPLYVLRWLNGEGNVIAQVDLVEPESFLAQLYVTDGKYIQRDALTVHDREKLLEVPEAK